MALRGGQLRRATRRLFEDDAPHAVTEKLVDVSLDLCDRQLQHNRRLLGLLIVGDGEDRENEFREAQITEFLCGSEFAVENLAL